MVSTEQHVVQIPEELRTARAAGQSEETVFAFPPALVDQAKAFAVWLVVLDRSCIVWLGDVCDSARPDLQSLVVSMYSQSLGPMTSTLLAKNVEDAWDNAGEGLSARLARKFDIQVFLSDQLSSALHQSPLCHFVELTVTNLLSAHFPRASKPQS